MNLEKISSRIILELNKTIPSEILIVSFPDTREYACIRYENTHMLASFVTYHKAQKFCNQRFKDANFVFLTMSFDDARKLAKSQKSISGIYHYENYPDVVTHFVK